MSIIIGTWPLSGDFGRVRLEQIGQTLRSCVEREFLEFDTAPNYGNGFIEACLGKEIATVDGVRFNTKFGSRPFAGKSFEIADLTTSLEHSLVRLSVERIHVLFLHNPRHEIDDYDPILRLFEDLKRQGKIEKSGISLAKGHAYARDLLQHVDVLQDDANLLNLSALRTVAEVTDTSFMARSPLATGILGGHIDGATTFAHDDHRSAWLQGDRLRSIMRRVELIRSTSDLPLPQLAYRFLLSHPRIDDVICGVRRPEHVQQLADCRDAPPLNDRIMSDLEELWRRDFGLVGEASLGY